MVQVVAWLQNQTNAKSVDINGFRDPQSGHVNVRVAGQNIGTRNMANNRVDANHSRIVKELRQLGYSVVSTADLGDGFPDICVGSLNTVNRNFLFEIKDWKQPPSKRRLTPKEKQFHAAWKGQVAVIETTEEALKVMA